MNRRPCRPIIQLLVSLGLSLLSQLSHADTVDLALKARQGGDLALAAEILTTINQREPNSPRVKLELARVLFEQGRYPSAKQLLDDVLTTDLPDPVRHNAESFWQMVNQRIAESGSAHWRHALALELGNSDRFSVVTDGSRDQDSNGVDPYRDERLDAGHDQFAQASWFGYRRPAGAGWLFDGSLRVRDYVEVDSADSRWAQLRGGWRFEPWAGDGLGHEIDATVVARQLSVDGRTSFESVGAALGWHFRHWDYPLSANVEWLERQYQEISGDDPRDGQRLQLQLNQAGWFADHRWAWRWGASYWLYRADGKALDYDIYEGVAALSFRPAVNWNMSIETSYADIRFVRPEIQNSPANVFFSPRVPPGFELRRSDRWQLRLSAERQLADRWLAEIGVTGFFYDNEGLTEESNQSEAFAKLTWVIR